jgi:UDP-glucose 4-epimerase
MESINTNPNRVYNLGTEIGHSVYEIIEIMKDVSRLPIKYTHKERRKGDPSTLIATYAKAKKELGWYPQKSIKEIIKSAYTWRKLYGNF